MLNFLQFTPFPFAIRKKFRKFRKRKVSHLMRNLLTCKQIASQFLIGNYSPFFSLLCLWAANSGRTKRCFGISWGSNREAEPSPPCLNSLEFTYGRSFCWHLDKVDLGNPKKGIESVICWNFWVLLSLLLLGVRSVKLKLVEIKKTSKCVVFWIVV
jgi:hypothetical protein